MRIIIDAFGGDNAPLEVIKGARMAVDEYGCEIVLCGDSQEVCRVAGDMTEDIYNKYGFYTERTVSFTMPGKDGMDKMAKILAGLRETPLVNVAGMDIIKYTDYQNQTIKDTKGNVSPLKGHPKSNVLRYDLSDEKTYFIVRPSGTEPKIKIYLGTFADSTEDAEKIIDKVLSDAQTQLGL